MGWEWRHVAERSREPVSPGMSRSRVPALPHISCVSKLRHRSEIQYPNILNLLCFMTVSMSSYLIF